MKCSRHSRYRKGCAFCNGTHARNLANVARVTEAASDDVPEVALIRSVERLHTESRPIATLDAEAYASIEAMRQANDDARSRNTFIGPPRLPDAITREVVAKRDDEARAAFLRAYKDRAVERDLEDAIRERRNRPRCRNLVMKQLYRQPHCDSFGSVQSMMRK